MRQLHPFVILTFTMLAAHACGTANPLPVQMPPQGDAAVATGGSAGSHDAGGEARGGADGGGGGGTGGKTTDAGTGISCGPTTCLANQYCCNASCGTCAPRGAACIQVVCDPLKPDAGSSGACRADSDCRLFDDYCTGCDCRALAKNDPDPTCSGPGVRCIVQPCFRKTASCIAGKCVAR